LFYKFDIYNNRKHIKLVSTPLNHPLGTLSGAEGYLTASRTLSGAEGYMFGATCHGVKRKVGFGSAQPPHIVLKLKNFKVKLPYLSFSEFNYITYILKEILSIFVGHSFVTFKYNPMKKSLFFAVSMVAVMALSILAQPAEKAGNPEREVHELFELSMRLFKEKNLDGLVNRFDPQGSLKLPGQGLIKGHDGLREFYTGTLQLTDFELKLTIPHVEISGSGDMAWAQSDYSVSFISPEGPFLETGITLMVLKRSDNQWKIMAENLSPNKTN
jgi:ketosteroid isomerase-like protein